MKWHILTCPTTNVCLETPRGTRDHRQACALHHLVAIVETPGGRNNEALEVGADVLGSLLAQLYKNHNLQTLTNPMSYCLMWISVGYSGCVTMYLPARIIGVLQVGWWVTTRPARVYDYVQSYILIVGSLTAGCTSLVGTAGSYHRWHCRLMWDELLPADPQSLSGSRLSRSHRTPGWTWSDG